MRLDSTLLSLGKLFFTSVIIISSLFHAVAVNSTNNVGTSNLEELTVLVDPIVITETVNDATTNGGTDGSITLVVSGGTAPYT